MRFRAGFLIFLSTFGLVGCKITSIQAPAEVTAGQAFEVAVSLQADTSTHDYEDEPLQITLCTAVHDGIVPQSVSFTAKTADGGDIAGIAGISPEESAWYNEVLEKPDFRGYCFLTPAMNVYGAESIGEARITYLAQQPGIFSVILHAGYLSVDDGDPLYSGERRFTTEVKAKK